MANCKSDGSKGCNDMLDVLIDWIGLCFIPLGCTFVCICIHIRIV